LDDDPVDLVIELCPAPLPLGAGLRDLLDRLEPLGIRIRPEAPLPQPLERLEVRVGRDALAVARAVDPDRERPRRRDPGVELAERAGSGIPRIRRRGLAGRDLLFVETTEAREREVDLAANLHQRGRLAFQRERNRPDRAEVDGDVLAALPVAARRAAHELPVLVD